MVSTRRSQLANRDEAAASQETAGTAATAAAAAGAAAAEAPAAANTRSSSRRKTGAAATPPPEQTPEPQAAPDASQPGSAKRQEQLQPIEEDADGSEDGDGSGSEEGEEQEAGAANGHHASQAGENAPAAAAGAAGAGAGAAPATGAGRAAAAAGPPGEDVDPLDAFRKLPELRQALQQLQTRVDDSAVFLRPSAEVAEAARVVAKLLYKCSVGALMTGGSKAEKRALARGPAAPLPDLHTDASFDPEQIWLQLELATEAAVRRVRRLVRSAEPLAEGAAGLVTPEAEAGLDRLLAGASSDEGDEDDEDEDGMGGSSDGDMGEGGSSDLDEDEDEEEGGRARKKARLGDKAAAGKKAAAKKAASKKGPGVEDRFFRLSDMEKYVEEAERRVARGDDEDDDDVMGEGDEGMGEGDEEEDDSEGMEALLAAGDDEDEEDGGMAALLRDSEAAAGKGRKGKGGEDGAGGGLRYKDFFGPGGDDDEDEEDEDEDEEGGEEGSEGEGEGLDGEEDGEEEEGLLGRRGKGGAGLLSSEGGTEDMEEDEDEEGAKERRQSGRDAGPRSAGGKAAAANMSTHERRLLRMQERVAELEREALADKSWHLVGEVTGQHRPMNSALELDMEFENTAKPVPVQTEEMTNDLEALIRKRIQDRRFDDVVRVVPPPIEGRKKEVELDDSKAKAGLGELYEQDYVRQVAGGTAEDKDEKLRQEARQLFKALCGKLDALTRFHFAPKPVIEDMTVKSEVPAIVMEEAAPVAVSKAAMALPGEVYAPAAKDGQPKAESELTREERKQRRAKKKRAHKAKTAAKDAEARAKAVAAGGSADIVGRKSEAKVVAGKGIKVAAGAGAAKHGRTDMGTSGAVFAKLAAEQAAAASGVVVAKPGRELRQAKQEGGARKGAAALKL